MGASTRHVPGHIIARMSCPVRQDPYRAPGRPPTSAALGVLGGEGRRLVLPLLGLLACLAVLSAGCEDIRREFVPLATGNSWVYRLRSGGRDLGHESIRVGDELGAHAGREDAGGEDVPRAGHDSRMRFYRVTEPGGGAVWGTDSRGNGGTVVRSSGAARSVVLLHPPFIGSGWRDEAPAPRGVRGQTVFCKVIAREAVETPAGWFFDCVVVRREAEDRSSIVTQWFAADVGLVKWRVERPGKQPVEWALERHEVKYR